MNLSFEIRVIDPSRKPVLRRATPLPIDVPEDDEESER
jgi:hypothetical protein